MSNPSIGIGLPVYQNEQFLAATLDSILAQSYTEFVVYLSEDQSNDKTADICLQYAAMDPRIRYSQNATNLGEIGNYQKVLDLADTDYFMFARGHEILPANLLNDCIEILENDKDVVLAFAKTIWIDEQGNHLPKKNLPHFDTRGCDVAARCALTFWGKYEAFYGVTRTATMKSIKALEPIVATDLIMLFEMSLLGTFANINAGTRYRRYYYSNESYADRIKRYQRTLYQQLSFMDRHFPFIKVPIKLIACAFRSPQPFSTKLILLLIILFNAPLRYLSARGKTL
ncbi:MAG: glycosyltransferase [Flavobacteriales bacterium]|nr:glycosyltransferase [Gammaproteobacteria bacterium]MBL4667916.1 glycosyltransferase [Flavobacteriales bacterium]